jgi:methanogenic corrinoid protein MtbC1
MTMPDVSICFDIWINKPDYQISARQLALRIRVAPPIQTRRGTAFERGRRMNQVSDYFSKAPQASETDDAQNSKAVYRFASHVVAMLASRANVPASTIREVLLLQLIEAVVSEDPTAAVSLLADLREQNISVEQLTDYYLPEAARALGDAWDNDQADFIDVTIGAMRLQSLLRGLDGDDLIANAHRPTVGSVLMIVPNGEQHTLGALVAAAQIRRKGVAVCIRIMPRTNELRELLRGRSFDGIMISVSSHESLDLAGKLIDLLRKMPERRTPVVLGGSLLSFNEDLKSATGADIVTNDITVALESCGLSGAHASAAWGRSARR